jgi:hypothetical protein
LLETACPLLRNDLQCLLETWKRRRDSLLLAADDARKRCLPDVGDLFLNHARTLGNHIELLAGALREADRAAAVDLGEPAKVA